MDEKHAIRPYELLTVWEVLCSARVVLRSLQSTILFRWMRPSQSDRQAERMSSKESGAAIMRALRQELSASTSWFQILWAALYARWDARRCGNELEGRKVHRYSRLHQSSSR
jgi:hypothetical protein